MVEQEARNATGGLRDLGNFVFVDASALIALADRDDVSHQAAVDAYREMIGAGLRLFTTDLALVSAHEIILAALGPTIARTWLAQCAIFVQSITLADLEEGRRAIEEGTCPPHAALAEAVHLAVLDRLGVTDVFAVDRSFLEMLG